jgi:hypothetical protein
VGVTSGNGGTPAQKPAPAGTPTKGVQPVEPPKVTAAVVGVNPQTGATCYEFIQVDLTAVLRQRVTDLVLATQQNIPPCPQQPAGAPVPPVTPVELAEEFWYTVHLPVPRPVSSPDYATTGKPAYLQAGDTDAPPTWTRATPLGLLQVTARGTYTVTWGDGPGATGPYDNPGGPYPTGIITHTYDATGTVTIVVREKWRATWRMGAAQGTLADLHTTGILADFPVRQIQAVITS